MPTHKVAKNMAKLLHVHWKAKNKSDVSQLRTKVNTIFLFNVSMEYMSVVITYGASPIPIDENLAKVKVFYDVNGSKLVEVAGVMEKLLLWYPFWFELRVSALN
jgi:hypothetical protein